MTGSCSVLRHRRIINVIRLSDLSNSRILHPQLSSSAQGKINGVSSMVKWIPSFDLATLNGTGTLNKLFSFRCFVILLIVLESVKSSSGCSDLIRLITVISSFPSTFFTTGTSTSPSLAPFNRLCHSAQQNHFISVSGNAAVKDPFHRKILLTGLYIIRDKKWIFSASFYFSMLFLLSFII